MGTNWAYNTSFLAQAPGPGSDGEGLGIDPVDLAHTTTTLNIQQGDNLFKQSWAAHWTPISDSSNIGGGGGGSSGLSGGAIGGIVGGVVGGLLIIGAIIAFLLVRRKRKARQTAAQQPSYAQPGYAPPGQAAPHSPGQAYYYADKLQEPRHEMHADPSYRQELDAQSYYNTQYKKPEHDQYGMLSSIQNVSELPGHDPQELPANPRSQ
jgi:hypothetical protein